MVAAVVMVVIPVLVVYIFLQNYIIKGTVSYTHLDVYKRQT